ncbi:MAG: oxidoreductase [Gammaproteobacteria bacterium]|nr:oxidoreductase [Gammaproteobacteria bacterium]
MKALQLWFTGSHTVELREQKLNKLQAGHVLIKTLCSAVSSGTELLLYRGQIPETLVLDENLSAYKGSKIKYPLQFGYACVGIIEAIGERVDNVWLGKHVFTFQPHSSHNICPVEELITLPDNIDPLAAVFLANMETAVNLIHDGNPLLGECSVVIGQGIVGLLTSSLLSQFPLGQLYTLENIKMRQEMSKNLNVNATFSSNSSQDILALKKALQGDTTTYGADLVFELSGSPASLDLAVELTGYSGRIVVGSWYGSKTAEINLGERFHRNRISIISSQVSNIAPKLAGRWDKSRRYAQAWDMIKKCKPENLITHRVSFNEAAEAYRLLDEFPEEAVQVVFDY